MPGQFSYNWFDKPAQSGGYIAGKRYRPDLDVNSALTLFESPIGIGTPQVSVAHIGGDHRFVRLPGVLHFGNARGVRPAEPARPSDRRIVHIVVGIEYDRGDFLLEKPQIDFEIAAVMTQQL